MEFSKNYPLEKVDTLSPHLFLHDVKELQVYFLELNKMAEEDKIAKGSV